MTEYQHERTELPRAPHGQRFALGRAVEAGTRFERAVPDDRSRWAGRSSHERIYLPESETPQEGEAKPLGDTRLGTLTRLTGPYRYRNGGEAMITVRCDCGSEREMRATAWRNKRYIRCNKCNARATTFNDMARTPRESGKEWWVE